MFTKYNMNILFWFSALHNLNDNGDDDYDGYDDYYDQFAKENFGLELEGEELRADNGM